MNLTFKNYTVIQSVESIMHFQSDEESAYWSNPLFYFYPDIDKERFKDLSMEERKVYLQKFFEKFSLQNETILKEKLLTYTERWNLYRSQIVAAFEDAFSIKLDNLFNDLECYISFNCVSPRFLKEKYFEVFYLNSANGALGVILHELIHYIWFYVWNQHFKDSYEEYEKPHLKWILSEMVVEPIMRDERLRSLNPYFDDKACVYSYFYTMNIGGKPILDTLYDMYTSMPIYDFMEKSYEFCQRHETEIRKHMKDSEESVE